MILDERLREAIARGRLREPFSASEAAEALGSVEWPVARVHSYLVRYCRGNLTAPRTHFERASFGRYRLGAGSGGGGAAGA